MALVSIIVPVYNIEKYISKCVDSVLVQTFTNFKLILVDDGSTDGSGKICDDYCLRDSRIHVIHKINGGLSSARNAGLDYVFKDGVSDYVSFVDGDDYLDNHYLEYLINYIENYDIVVCKYNCFELDSNQISKYYNSDNIEAYESSSFFDICTSDSGNYLAIACCKLIKTELLINIRFKEGVIHEDEYFSNVFYQQDFNVLLIDKGLYYYVKRSNSLSSSKNIKEQCDLFFAFIERCIVCRSYKKRGTELYYYRFCCAIFGNILHDKNLSSRIKRKMARALFLESIRIHRYKEIMKYLVLSII